MVVSPEDPSFSAEEISHSKGSLIAKGKELAHNTLSQSVENGLTPFKLHTWSAAW